jgi:hypothetical protein
MNPTPNPQISTFGHPPLQDSPQSNYRQPSSVSTALAFKRVTASRVGFDDYCDSLDCFLEAASRATPQQHRTATDYSLGILKGCLSLSEETPTQYDELVRNLYYTGGGAFQLIKYRGDFRSTFIHAVDKGILEIPFEVLSNAGLDPRPHPQQDGTHDRMQLALGVSSSEIPTAVWLIHHCSNKSRH